MILDSKTIAFVQRAVEVHGTKYDYSRVEYINAKTKVDIICFKHGMFQQTAFEHTSGAGCRKCYFEAQAKRQSHTVETFVEKARKVHGDKFDYSRVKYKTSKDKVEIVCPKHGVFWQEPRHHTGGHTCEKCGKDSLAEMFAFTADEFIQRAESVHGKRFDYSQMEYKNCQHKIKIVCPVHGPFMQHAGSHLSGVGCRSCSENGFNKSKAGVLYVLKSESMVKVGITNRPVEKRVNELNQKSPEIFSVVRTFGLDGEVCYSAEQSVLGWLKGFAQRPTNRFSGYKETFLGVDVSDVIKKIEEVVNG